MEPELLYHIRGSELAAEQRLRRARLAGATEEPERAGARVSRTRKMQDGRATVRASRFGARRRVSACHQPARGGTEVAASLFGGENRLDFSVCSAMPAPR